MQQVDRRLARLLKEAGYRGDCVGFYPESPLLPVMKYTDEHEGIDPFLPAPYYEEVVEWLVEEKGISIEPYYFSKGAWSVTICIIKLDDPETDVTLNGYDSRSQALFGGIEEVLEMGILEKL